MQNYAAQSGHSLTLFALVSNDSNRPSDGLPDSGTIYEDFGEPDADRDAYIEEVFRENCRIFDFIVSVLLVGFSCMLGFFGNIISIVILRRDPRKSVTLFLLTSLAVADFLFLIPITFLFSVPGACRFMVTCSPTLRNLLPYINQYGWAVASMAHTGTVYITVLVTIHRYLSVCRPMDAPKLSTLSLARTQVILVIVFAVIFNIPRFLEFRIRSVIHLNEDGSQVVTTKRAYTAFGANIWYQILYKNLCFYLFMYIIPLTTLIILSAKLTKTLRERKRYRFRVSLRRRRKEDNTTLVLIIIVLLFIICQTPTPFQRLFYTVFGDEGRMCGHFFFYFERFADYLAVLNSCVNFMVYVIFAKGFRQTLKNTLCRNKKLYRSGMS